MQEGRTARGRFKPGVSGNPTGRRNTKPVGLKEALRREVAKVATVDENGKTRTWAEMLAVSLIRLAMEGNSAAINQLWNRCEGVMTPQLIDDQQDGAAHMTVTFVRPDGTTSTVNGHTPRSLPPSNGTS